MNTDYLTAPTIYAELTPVEALALAAELTRLANRVLVRIEEGNPDAYGFAFPCKASPLTANSGEQVRIRIGNK